MTYPFPIAAAVIGSVLLLFAQSCNPKIPTVLTVERNSRQIVTQLASPESVPQIGVTFGDTVSFPIQFGRRDGVVEEIDAASALLSLKVGAKLGSDFAGTYLASNYDGSEFAYTKTGTDTDATYTVPFFVNFASLQTALAAATTTPKYVDLYLEIEFVLADGTRESTEKTTILRVTDDVNKGGESIPAPVEAYLTEGESDTRYNAKTKDLVKVGTQHEVSGLTLENFTGVSFAVESGETWAINLRGVAYSPDAGGIRIKIAMPATAGATKVGFLWAVIGDTAKANTNNDFDFEIDAADLSDETVIDMTGMATFSASGTVQLQVAQETALGSSFLDAAILHGKLVE